MIPSKQTYEKKKQIKNNKHNNMYVNATHCNNLYLFCNLAISALSGILIGCKTGIIH